MDYLLTRYIYPLEEKFVVSDRIGIYFENPSDDTDIRTCENLIRKSYQKNPIYQIPEDYLTEQLHRFYREQASNSDYFAKLWAQYSELTGIQILARSWIIQRWEGNKFNAEDISYLISVTLGIEIPYLCHGLGLVFIDDLMGDEHTTAITQSIYTFISHITDVDSVRKVATNNAKLLRDQGLDSIWLNIFENFFIETVLPSMNSFSDDYFPEIADEFTKLSKLIDQDHDNEFDEILLFLADYLHLVYDTKDNRISIVLLVSIIEALVTHNPVRNGTADSVSKQFQTKVSELVLQNDETKEPYKLKEQLREIYWIRSKIAHAELKSIEKVFSNDNREYVSSIKQNLRQYIRLILKQFFSDPKVIEKLKYR